MKKILPIVVTLVMLSSGESDELDWLSASMESSTAASSRSAMTTDGSAQSISSVKKTGSSSDNNSVVSTEEKGIGPTMPQLPIRRVGGALIVVVGGFLFVSLFFRNPASSVPAHAMMEPLGSVPIAPKIRLHLVRFGKRILVLHINGQNVQRVAELEDPEEVERLLSSHSQVRSTRGLETADLPRTVNELLNEHTRDSLGESLGGALGGSLQRTVR